MSDEFFLPGIAEDKSYINIRDKEQWKDGRAFTEELWQIYRPYADDHAQSDAKTHFLQRFWEMYVACTLLKQGFKIERVGKEGPEFYFIYEGQRIWVEAIAPGPGNGPDYVPETESGKAYRVPTDKVLLRFTHALLEKHRKYKIDLDKGIIKPEDQIIFAINSRGIPHAPYGSDLPYIIKAYLPFGDLTYAFDRDTKELKDQYHQLRENIRKENGAHVSTNCFLDPEYSAFSAVIHSSVDCINRPPKLGGDFTVLHNPSALYKLPEDIFLWCCQYFYNDGLLNKLKPALNQRI